jgi:hypothetical protein
MRCYRGLSLLYVITAAAAVDLLPSALTWSIVSRWVASERDVGSDARWYLGFRWLPLPSQAREGGAGVLDQQHRL